MKTKMANVSKKWLLSCIVVVVLSMGLSNTMDSNAQLRLSNSFNNALATFALVRGINAVISVVQGTEVALEPGGVGVVLTPGEVLDPINDLIERFSWVVLAAGTSLGAQLILLEIGTSFFALVLVAVACIILLVLLWTPLLAQTTGRGILIRCALMVLLLRFLVPVVVLANEFVYNAFLSESYSQSYEVLENVSKDVQELKARDENDAALAESSAREDAGIFDSVSRFYNRTKQKLSLSGNYQKYEEKVAGAAQQIINLIAIFIFQTLVFPLMFFWLAVRLGRTLMRGEFWLADKAK